MSKQVFYVGVETVVPTKDTFSKNYPNPFNPTTTIMYSLEDGSHVTLAVFNITGQKVTTLVDDYRESGEHQVIWDGHDANGNQVASGIYLYRIKNRKLRGNQTHGFDEIKSFYKRKKGQTLRVCPFFID